MLPDWSSASIYTRDRLGRATARSSRMRVRAQAERSNVGSYVGGRSYPGCNVTANLAVNSGGAEQSCYSLRLDLPVYKYLRQYDVAR